MIIELGIILVPSLYQLGFLGKDQKSGIDDKKSRMRQIFFMGGGY